MSPVRCRVGVLISGRGSNLGALIAAALAPDYPAAIVLVLSNRADAGGLAVARGAGVPAEAFEPVRGAGRAAHEARLDAALRAAAVEVVVLAGYMRVLSPAFCAAWSGRLINVHPSLLPALPGLDTHRRALAAGARLHGCTAHFVVPEVDAGPAIAQAAVPVLPGDDEASLAARVLAQEHRLLPRALALVAGGAARLEDDRVVFADGVAFDAGAALASP